VYEVIALDPDLTQLLRSGAHDAHGSLVRKGIRGLADLAFDLLRSGRTSLEEIYPILASD
jgi:general secretion pathway protein E/type IV pilus assembly protein PilB